MRRIRSVLTDIVPAIGIVWLIPFVIMVLGLPLVGVATLVALLVEHL